MPNKLDQLKLMTDVVADTGDIAAMREYTPRDATTNPSLLLKAANLPQYAPLVEAAQQFAQSSSDPGPAACDRLAVLIGKEISQIVPGRVSTEVDARLSFNTQATVTRGQQIIDAYQELGVPRDRILIKIASTWEGIEAARQLECEGINCNLTLLFGFEQAVACAHAGVTLISPFVGRILDWHKARDPSADFSGANDPGVASVKRIYNFYKANGFDTIVMGASFRSAAQVCALSGCDRLTISPDLLAELAQDTGLLDQALTSNGATSNERTADLAEDEFRFALNDDAMSTEKLAEGIRTFAADQRTLEQQLLRS